MTQAAEIARDQAARSSNSLRSAAAMEALQWEQSLEDAEGKSCGGGVSSMVCKGSRAVLLEAREDVSEPYSWFIVLFSAL
jgi:hypothetical protein